MAALQHAIGAGRQGAGPIPIWKRGDERFVIDDIERFEHCSLRGVELTYDEFEFESEDQARLFVLERNQSRQLSSALGRRYIDGAIYNLSRKPGARTDLTCPQAEGKSASAKLMQRFGRSRASLERDGRLARQIDEAAAAQGVNVRAMLLDPKYHLTAAHIERFASLNLDGQDTVLDALRRGEVDDLIRRPAVPAAERQGKRATGIDHDPVEAAQGTAPTFAMAVQTLLEQMGIVEAALDDPTRSGLDATLLLEQSARQIASRHATLKRKFKEAQARPATTPVQLQSAPESSPLPPMVHVLANWTRPPEELSAEAIVGDIERMLRLAEALEEESRDGVPLGSGGTFVTTEALRARAEDFEVELARRHVSAVSQA